MSKLSLFILLPIVAVSSVSAFEPIGAEIDESSVFRTLRVDPAGGGDFTNLQDAIQASRLGNRSHRIVLAPGLYREGAYGINSRQNLTIIEAEEPGSVVFTGMDVWTDWEDEGNGVYSKEWTFDWGMGFFDPTFYSLESDLATRAEIVSYNGERLVQVEGRANLIEGSYAVDEDADLIYLKPPPLHDWPNDTIEVSTRPYFLYAFGTSNLVLRNLVVENYASGNQHGAEGSWTVLISGWADDDLVENILIDGCIFRGNNSSGLSMARINGLTVRNSSFVDNGGAGASLSRSQSVLMEDSVFDRNNWRIGGYGRFYDWGPAGIKFLYVGNGLIRNCTFSDNLATGLWLDSGIENFLVHDNVMNNNYQAGIYIEMSYGPVLVENNLMLDNALQAEQGSGMNHGGLLIAESRDVLATGNVMENNSHAQFMVRTRNRSDDLAGYLSETPFGGWVEDVTLLYNRMKGRSVSPPSPHPDLGHWVSPTGLMQMATHSRTQAYEEAFMPTVKSDFNSFYHETETELFSTGPFFGFTKVTLEAWQTDFGLDLSSVWEADYSPPADLPSSLFLHRFGTDSFLGADAYESAWFGSFWDMGDNWLFHEAMGYMQLDVVPRFDAWVWSQSLGFTWLAEDLYPFLYTLNQGWIYLADYGESSWVFIYATDTWQQLL